MILSYFFPDRIEKSIWNIDFELEYEKGFRAVIFDIDNTLVSHGSEATEPVVSLFDKLRGIGFQTCLISNNDEKRVGSFAEKVDSLYLPDAGKPLTKSYLRAMALLNSDCKNTLLIGDQILTDIWGAKRLRISNILVEPADRESDPLWVRAKRCLEGIILASYRKNRDAEK